MNAVTVQPLLRAPFSKSDSEQGEKKQKEGGEGERERERKNETSFVLVRVDGRNIG